MSFVLIVTNQVCDHDCGREDYRGAPADDSINPFLVSSLRGQLTIYS